MVIATEMLASLMVNIGELSGRDVIAVLSDMNQPLGMAVGNALEMKEAIETLRGEGPEDFKSHCLEIASHMLVLGKKAETKDQAMTMAEEAINSGSGFESFRKLIEVQGGDVSYVDHPEKLPEAPYKMVIEAPEEGYISEVHARKVGETAVLLGAGRIKKGEPVDLAVGIMVHVKVGDHIENGQPLFVIHARDEDSLHQAKDNLKEAVKISPIRVDTLPHFHGVIKS